jgi:transketolase N-terminal domain/subunit
MPTSTFSSKGHDVPALYSLLIAIEKLDFSLLPKLRQLNGLPGHPDVSTPFIAANTGSLAWASRRPTAWRAPIATPAAAAALS